MLKKQATISTGIALFAALSLCILTASKSSAQSALSIPLPTASPQVMSTPDASFTSGMGERSMNTGASPYQQNVMGASSIHYHHHLQHASGGSAGIVQTVFSFVDNAGHNETPGYGRYSYVVFVRRDNRASVLLNEIMKSTAEEGTVSALPAQLNLLEIPVRSPFWSSPVGTAARNGAADSKSADQIIANYYDAGAAQNIMQLACQDPSVKAKICKGELSQGPFLVTLPHPMSATNLLAPPYLVVDLGGVNALGFDYFVERFKEEANSENLSDRSRIDNFKNRILTLVLDASDWLPGTVSLKEMTAEAGS